MPTERPRRRLADIRENVDRIESHVAGLTFQQFRVDDKSRDAVERCLERIAEAARKLGDRYDDRYPDLDLLALRQMAETEIARIDRGE